MPLISDEWLMYNLCTTVHSLCTVKYVHPAAVHIYILVSYRLLNLYFMLMMVYLEYRVKQHALHVNDLNNIVCS